MKIFVIKGKINGMAKLSGKLQLSGCDYAAVQEVILFDGDNIKVLQKADIESQFVQDNYIGIVLLADDKRVLGVGSCCGKIDLEKVLAKYNFLNRDKNITSNINSNIDVEKVDTKEKKITKKPSKIDSNLTNKENLKQKDNFSDNKKEDAEEIILQNQKGQIKKYFDLVDLANMFMQNDDLSYDTNAKNEVTQHTESEQKNENDLTNNCIKEDLLDEGVKKQNSACVNYENSEQIEVVLSKNEDIAKGVDFAVKELKKNSSNKNYFAEIKADLDKFFKSYPRNEELESKVFGSKWVRITADYDYSVGVIFEDDKPSIIAYAEPYEDKSQVDVSKLQLGEWLKIEDSTGLTSEEINFDRQNKNRGYFIFYQNADTGEMILNTGF